MRKSVRMGLRWGCFMAAVHYRKTNDRSPEIQRTLHLNAVILARTAPLPPLLTRQA